MRIVAALCWWNEPPASLARCAASLAGVADALVAFDGRWDGMPGEQVNSPIEQGLALHDAARAASVSLAIRTPERGLWASQVEKRDAMMETAAEFGDWILVIDADEHVTAADSDSLRELLELSEHDVAEIGHVTVGERARNSTVKPARRLFRAATAPAVEVAHNGVRAADGRWLAGDGRFVELDAASDAAPVLVLAHELDGRPRDRAKARAEYLRFRAAEHVEDWAGAVA